MALMSTQKSLKNPNSKLNESVPRTKTYLSTGAGGYSTTTTGLMIAKTSQMKGYYGSNTSSLTNSIGRKKSVTAVGRQQA